MPRQADVTLIQLRYFVKAASHLSMTRAADELRIAQSAVSAAVSQLEHQIGTQLFIRHRARGLVLTAAGEEMLRDTRGLLDHLDEVLDVASGHVDQIRGRVRLACFVTLGPFILPRLIAELGEQHPDLHVDVIETEAHAMRTALRNGSAEVALTYDLGLGAGVTAEVLGVAPPYVALARDHPLADSEAVDLADLADEPMVLLDLPESREYFETMLIAAGVTPQIRYRSASYETVRGLVARGHGYSILNQRPASAGTYDGGTVVAVPIKGDAPALPVVLARSAAVRTTARARAVAVAARAIFSGSGDAADGG
jgi:DNA-binding transcriptional LysR family regulator